VVQHGLKEGKSLKKEVKTKKDEDSENFQELLKSLERLTLQFGGFSKKDLVAFNSFKT